MPLKRRLFIFLFLIVAVAAARLLLQYLPDSVDIYNKFIFCPLQSLRGILLGFIPLSIGDLLYISATIWLLTFITRRVRNIIIKKSGWRHSMILFVEIANIALCIYLAFIIGWGANYSKPNLSSYWGLPLGQLDNYTDSQKRAIRLNEIIAFDTFLINQLNIYAPLYEHQQLGKTNELAKSYYKQYTNSKVTTYGLQIKPSLFGFYMQRTGIDGYYNPFTGEGQVDKQVPGFILPFIVCHEMAHQAGIAAEGDANLLAYALGTTTPDPSFRYSAYFEIWLYTHQRLHFRDTSLARLFSSRLNKLTRAHLDTLKQISRKYDNDVARYSNEIYDSYLKMQAQKEGIKSYGNVSASAFALEKERGLRPTTIINIP